MNCAHEDHATYTLRPRGGVDPLLLWCRQCGATLICGAGHRDWVLPQPFACPGCNNEGFRRYPPPTDRHICDICNGRGLDG
jgi:hypothetical protein